MHTYTIDPETLLPHGAVRTRIENGALCLTATRTLNTRFQNHDTPVQSYLRLPEKLHVPFTLRLRAALDDQALYILIGRGHVAFATGLTENRPITDILGGDFKPRARGFDNELSLGRRLRWKSPTPLRRCGCAWTASCAVWRKRNPTKRR